MTAGTRDRCEYLRTAVAIALWKYRGDQDKVSQLRRGCDNKQHLVLDQAAAANAMISAIAGRHQRGAVANLPELASSTGRKPEEISQAHLAGAALAWPEIAWHFDDHCAEGASEPLAWLTCSLIRHLGRDEQGGERLLAGLAEAATAAAMADLLSRAAGR